LQISVTSSSAAGLVCAIIFLIATGNILLQILSSSQPAFADGGFQQSSPPTGFGNRVPAVSITSTPSILISSANQDILLHFRVYDAKTNETIKFATLNIAIYNATDPKAKPILQDFFRSDNGLLALKIHPQGGDMQLRGNRDPFLGALQADPGGIVDFFGPLFVKPGTYHTRVGLFGIDYPTNIFADENVVWFDTYIHIGEEYHTDARFEDRDYPVIVTSYYDKVKGFNFDAGAETFAWSVPFDWNVTKLQKENATNILVRQDVKIPQSMLDIGDFRAFNATVNGRPVQNRTLVVDHVLEPGNVIFRFALHEDEILNIAKSNNYTANSNSNPQLMNFSLSFAPSVKTSSRITTDKDNIAVLLNWTPGQLKAFQSATLEMQFVNNGNGGSSINDTRIHDDVKYDIMILDNRKEPVFSASDQIAKGGAGNQTIRISADGGYLVEITVKGLIKSGQSLDTTRNGVATGTVLVPEFPASLSVFLSVGAAIAIITVMQRFAKQSGTKL
jgi:hypothetical protein